MRDLAILGVDNVMIAVGDLERARSFYEGALGLKTKFAFLEAGVIGYRLGDEEPGLVLRVGPLQPAPPRESPRVWLEVPDARAAATALRQAGVATLGEPKEVYTGWLIEIADPWGNVLGLTDYVKQPALGRTARGSGSSAGDLAPQVT